MFCKNVKSKLRSVLRSFDIYVDEHIDTALSITTALKKVLKSPVTDVVTTLIPGTIDDTIRQRLIVILERVTKVLSITDSCMEYEDTNDRLRCFAEQLSRTSPELQDALLQKMASLITRELDGERVKQNMYDLYTQAKYAAAKQ